MLHVIAPLVDSYRAAHPQVTLELHSNEGITDLIEHRTDVAFRIGTLRDSTLHARPLGSSRIRVLASPDYLARCGTPRRLQDLAGHTLLGFTQPETLNDWPLRTPEGTPLRIAPAIASSSGETLRQLALAGSGIVCLSDFMTREDRRAGRLVPLFVRQSLDIRQAIHAVYYRNTALSSRITSFLDHVVQRLGPRAFEAERGCCARRAARSSAAARCTVPPARRAWPRSRSCPHPGSAGGPRPSRWHSWR
jgi:DNA-binding transcriptional LysR family regulator